MQTAIIANEQRQNRDSQMNNKYKTKPNKKHEKLMMITKKLKY